MSEPPETIARILDRLENLAARQESIQNEIAALRTEINEITVSSATMEKISEEASFTGVPATEAETSFPSLTDAGSVIGQNQTPCIPEEAENVGSKPVSESPAIGVTPTGKSNLEKFIGENLINKIGIAVTVLGVGIGVKYAIDHELISPWTRIILGYLSGLVLFGLAVRLKKEYANFSAVLLSGSMAIMYFITFAAYNFYSLIPTVLTFLLMVLFTLFTVASALHYNKQVIAHIGLVGAYAVPFLLDDGSGRVVVMFSYMALINLGILVISLWKYWKPLFASSFVLTWLIFYLWFVAKYDPAIHFGMALTFVSVFFTTFYLVFLVYKLFKSEKHAPEDILMLLSNAAIYYGLGYAILKADKSGVSLLGLFTLANAIIHCAAAIIVRVKKPGDINMFHFTAGLALVFVTIAIPVQWDGRWVTLLWSGEAALLFWMGRTRNVSVYELLSYPLMFLVFVSLFDDWLTGYIAYNPRVPSSRIFPFLNVHFLTSLIFIASFGIINYLQNLKRYISPLAANKFVTMVMRFSIPGILITALYFSFIMEITNFWSQLYTDSMVTKNQDLTVPEHLWNEDLFKYSTLSVINFSLLFVSLLSFVNLLKLRNSLLGIINLGMNIIALCVFLTLGLFTIGELRESYLNPSFPGSYYHGSLDIAIRYLSFVFAGVTILAVFRYVRWELLNADFRKEFDFLLHITILTVAANELINWMDLYQPGQSYKLGLSILFGIYALLLIVIGIRRKKVHLRIGALVLFAATLIKLLLYDIAYLNTISKTIVFVSLGVLLLISSFLYTKYRKLIFGDHEENHDEGTPL
ncbi:MAG: DUF2339 domain-containing protein [Bacteroidota bacterium]